MRPIQAPVHGGGLQPVADTHQLRWRDTHTLLDCRHLQPAQHLAYLQARVGQLQQGQEGGNRGVGVPRITVGNRAGKRRYIVAQPFIAAREYSLHKGRVVLHVRAQHHHIAGLEAGVSVEPVQQPVV